MDGWTKKELKIPYLGKYMIGISEPVLVIEFVWWLVKKERNENRSTAEDERAGRSAQYDYSLGWPMFWTPTNGPRGQPSRSVIIASVWQMG